MWEDEAHCGQHHSLGLVVLNYIKSGESKLIHTSMHAFIPSLFFSVCVWLFHVSALTFPETKDYDLEL